MFSAAFRPFFLAAALWSAFAVPAWLVSFSGRAALPGALAPFIWHGHEMVYGFGFAAVAGFLLTAIPNWTGRLPLRGPRLAALAGLWLAGRIALLLSASIGPHAAAAIDLAFPAALIAVVARELIAGRNWRNLPMLAALALLLCGSLLVHLQAIGVAYTALLGNRVGIATLLMLIALVGGRIVPSFTRNWLAKHRPAGPMPSPAGPFDIAALAVTLAALACWVASPGGPLAAWLTLAAALALGLRLARWCGLATLGEPLLFVLHAGYGWLVVGFALLGLSGLVPVVPHSAALHALTVGAIGTMTLAVMTRATLGHSARPLSADRATVLVYLLVTLAALLRIAAPMAGGAYLALTWAAAAAWSGAFLLFAVSYRHLLIPRQAAHPLMQVKPVDK